MKRRSRNAFLVAIAALAALPCLPLSAQADFGIQSFSAGAFNKDGSVALQAGSHPYEYKIDLTMNQDSEGTPEGTLRDFVVDLPPGMVGNPLAVPRCSGEDFEGSVPHCPGNTVIGVALIKAKGLPTVRTPVFNLTPPLGIPASIGFNIYEANSFQEASLRTGGDYGVSVSDITIPTIRIQSVTETIWGVPADPGHDTERGNCLFKVDSCPTDVAPAPFLTLPTSCDAPLKTTFFVDSLEEPGDLFTRSGFVGKASCRSTKAANPLR